MAFAFVGLILLLIYYILRSYINKYSWFFCGIIVALIMAVYSTFFLIVLKGNYIPFNSLDRKIFTFLVEKKLGYFAAIRTFNLSQVLYIISLTLFSNSFFAKRAENNSHSIKAGTVIALIFSAVYFYFYDPNTILHIYTRILSNPEHDLYFWVCCFDALLQIATYVFIFSPFLLIFRYKRRLSSRYKMYQLYGILLFITLTNLIYILIMNLSTMRQLFFLMPSSDLITVRIFGSNGQSYFTTVPYLIFIAMFLIMFVTGKFHLIRQGGVIHKFYMSQSLKREHQAVSGILHSVKNIILSYRVILDDLSGIDDEQKKDEALKELRNDMNAYIQNLTHTLTSNEIRGDFSPEKCFLSDIVDDALSEFTAPDKVKVIKKYTPKKEIVTADSYYLKAAVLNLIDNAGDAVSQKKDGGTITIEIISEFDLAILKVEDTGIGIKKADLKQIFAQYYTTKSHVTNCGIGLSFAYKIIKKHKGYISVQSKYGQGTVFNIIFQQG